MRQHRGLGLGLLVDANANVFPTLLYSMSDQFSQLKSILRSTSMSSTLVASAPVVAPSSSSEDNPYQLQVIVQDLSTKEAKGTENFDSKKEGGFEDYF
ncbi:hypothetical protein Bca4012_040091 [Brassica carinata]